MQDRRGIILSGGLGTRLYPLTKTLSKQLLPVFNKPMIYYPISCLMQAGIRDIMIISSNDHIDLYRNLLGDGESFGINFEYRVQAEPNGIPESFLIAEDFISNRPSCLILGDNVFHSSTLSSILIKCSKKEIASILGTRVKDPSRFGVVEISQNGEILGIEEKPLNPSSDIAVTGIYFYDEDVVLRTKELSKSPRGELEITDLNSLYLREEKLSIEILEDGVWFDCGTYNSLLECSNYIQAFESRMNNKIACIEEIAWRKGWIRDEDLEKHANKYGNSSFKKYLINLLNHENY